MASALLAVSLVCLLSGRSAQASDGNVTKTDRLEETFVSAKLRENMTLRCFYENDRNQQIYWFKKTPEQKPKLVASVSSIGKNGIFHGEYKDNPRFTLAKEDKWILLRIVPVELSDSATYLCLKQSYSQVFLDSVSVHVWDSALNIRASLHQSASECLHPGGSLNLNCQVPAEVRSHPQAGNYKCSVVSCAHGDGHSGNRSGLDFGGGVVSLPWLYFLGGPLAGALAASLAFWVCKTTSGGKTGDASTSDNDDGKEIQDSDKMYFPALLDGGRGDQTWSKCAYYCKKQQ